MNTELKLGRNTTLLALWSAFETWGTIV